MPITKDRFHKIILAGLHCERTRAELVEQALSVISATMIGDLNHAEAIEQIRQFCIANDTQTTSSHAHLRLEEFHWRVTHRRADKDRERKQRQRHRHQSQGSPPSLISEDQIAKIEHDLERDDNRYRAERISQALSAHLPELTPFGQYICKCGFIGSFGAWNEHERMQSQLNKQNKELEL